MTKFYNKYDLAWFIGLLLISIITLLCLLLTHTAHNTVSHVFFGFSVIGLCCLLFVWISRKKDNATFKKATKNFSESDKRIIDYYTFSNEYNIISYKVAKLRQTLRFLSIIILPTILNIILAITFSFI